MESPAEAKQPRPGTIFQGFGTNDPPVPCEANEQTLNTPKISCSARGEVTEKSDTASTAKKSSPDYSFELQVTTEKHRFQLAVVIIFGFVVLLGIAMIGKYADPLTLSGIFSAWIVAIVAFYFIQQNADRAQQQAVIISAKSQEKASSMADTIEEETERIRKVAETKIKEIEGQMMTYKKLAESATSDLERLRKKIGG